MLVGSLRNGMRLDDYKVDQDMGHLHTRSAYPSGVRSRGPRGPRSGFPANLLPQLWLGWWCSRKTPCSYACTIHMYYCVLLGLNARLSAPAWMRDGSPKRHPLFRTTGGAGLRLDLESPMDRWAGARKPMGFTVCSRSYPVCSTDVVSLVMLFRHTKNDGAASRI